MLKIALGKLLKGIWGILVLLCHMGSCWYQIWGFCSLLNHNITKQMGSSKFHWCLSLCDSHRNQPFHFIWDGTLSENKQESLNETQLQQRKISKICVLNWILDPDYVTWVVVLLTLIFVVTCLFLFYSLHKHWLLFKDLPAHTVF